MRSSSRPRKASNLVIGKKIVEGLVSWRGADLTTDLWIGNVDSSASYEEVKMAITQLGVDIVELEELERRRSKSFRLRIRRSELPKIKDPNFWPNGVVVRRYFPKRAKDDAIVSNQS